MRIFDTQHRARRRCAGAYGRCCHGMPPLVWGDDRLRPCVAPMYLSGATAEAGCWKPDERTGAHAFTVTGWTYAYATRPIIRPSSFVEVSTPHLPACTEGGNLLARVGCNRNCSICSLYVLYKIPDFSRAAPGRFGPVVLTHTQRDFSLKVPCQRLIPASL